MEQLLNKKTVDRKDYLNVSSLIVITIIIFYRLFYTEYSYTDDWFALWQHGSGKGVHELIPYGRYLTSALTNWLYNFVNVRTVHDLVFIRLFSFFGWMICIPVWYFIIKKIVAKENLPSILAFFSVLYLVCTPSVTIYIGWASCFEQFISNTSGLLSGYVLYSSIKYSHERIFVPSMAIIGSLVFGMIALFTYQNGFGCFLLPFLLHLISKPKNLRIVTIGIGFYLFISVIYYLFFKYNLRTDIIEESARTKLSIDVLPKIKFFFTRPLVSAFHFTYLVNEESIAGIIVSAFLFLAWIVGNFYKNKFLPISNRLKIIFISLFILALIYLPSLVVKEMYSSNRTLFALDLAVFFLAATTLFSFVKKYIRMLAGILCLLFVANAWYNFNQQFLNPVKKEYEQIRHFIENNYAPEINTFYFLRPGNDFFERKYGITRSWDEFGMPSTFPGWMPEFFAKQVVFERTGNRNTAEKMIIQQWSDENEFEKSALPLSKNIMLVNVEDILNH